MHDWTASGGRDLRVCTADMLRVDGIFGYAPADQLRVDGIFGYAPADQLLVDGICGYIPLGLEAFSKRVAQLGPGRSVLPAFANTSETDML